VQRHLVDTHAGQPAEDVKQFVSDNADWRSVEDQFRAALKSVIADGTYDRILKKYNVEGIALKTAPINDPTITP